MSFKEAFAGGVAILRSALQSPGFLTGQVGWSINQDGSAEFNNLTIHGTFSNGFSPNARVTIPANQNNIYFYSGLAGETFPGQIGTGNYLGTPFEGLEILSPRSTTNPQNAGIAMLPGASNVAGSRPVVQITNDDGTPGQTCDLQVSQGNVIVQGNYTGSGYIEADSMTLGSSQDTSSRTTASTTYVSLGTAAVTITMPPSGRALIYGWCLISNGAANEGLMSVEVRDTNAAGSILMSASDVNAARSNNAASGFQSCSFMRPFSAGVGVTTLFARPMYRSTNAADTVNFGQTFIAVIPLP